MSDKKQQVIELMKPLIQQAEREGKWLESTYQNIPFSPKELRKEMSEGRYCWGPVNWRLIDPRSLLVDISATVKSLEEKNERILKAIEASR